MALLTTNRYQSNAKGAEARCDQVSARSQNRAHATWKGKLCGEVKEWGDVRPGHDSDWDRSHFLCRPRVHHAP